MMNNDKNYVPTHAISPPCNDISREVVTTQKRKGGGSPKINSKVLAPLSPASKVVSNRIGQDDARKMASIPLWFVKVSISLSPTNSS
jgi:hypothetical protein